MEDAAAIAGYRGVDGAQRPKPRDRTLFVSAYEPAVAGHIGGQDGSKPAFDTLVRHGPPLLAIRCVVYHTTGCSGRKA